MRQHFGRLAFLTIAGLLLLGLSALPGAAQPADETLVGVSGDSYASPTWGFALTWDGRAWEAVEATSRDGNDTLVLRSRRSTLSFQAGAGYRGDAAACLKDYADSLSRDKGVADWKALTNASGEGDGRAYAAYSLNQTSESGAKLANVNAIECRTLVARQAVLAIVHVTDQRNYETEVLSVADILETILLASGEADQTPTAPPAGPAFSVPTCFGQVATVIGAYNQYGEVVFNGTPGNDVIIGTEGQDVIKGEGGDDLICALGDADIIHAGDGNDTIDAGEGKDSVNGQDGNDVIYGRGGDDLLQGDAGDDIIYGGDGNDGLGGWDGNDVLLGEAGDDTLEGMAGVDQLDGGLGNDFCHGGTTVGGAENDTAVNCETAVAIP